MTSHMWIRRLVHRVNPPILVQSAFFATQEFTSLDIANDESIGARSAPAFAVLHHPARRRRSLARRLRGYHHLRTHPIGRVRDPTGIILIPPRDPPPDSAKSALA